jgi:hypothetical protein
VAIRQGGKRPSDYLKPVQERGFRRVINIDLDDPRFDPVFAYAVACGPDRPVQDGIRDLLLQAVSVNAENTAIRNARHAAYTEARNGLTSRLFLFLKTLAAEYENAPAGSENVGVDAGNMISKDAIERGAA